MLPPNSRELEIGRAGSGAGMMAMAVYFAIVRGDIAGGFDALANRLSIKLPPLAWVGIGALILLFLTGALLIYVGVSKAGGEREPIFTATALASASIAGAVLWHGAYFPNWPVLNLFLKAFYLRWLAASGTRFLLSLRSIPVSQLPDPEDVPDMPMSGPASRAEAETGMTGAREWVPPRFKT